jgi:hypothetical protein
METTTLLKIGDVMPDGTIYAGISPDTNAPMFTTAKDAPFPMNWHTAATYARDLFAHGRADWRVPTSAELNVLFNNRAAIGGFTGARLLRPGWYWSSSEQRYFDAKDQRFSDGHQSAHRKYHQSAVRCIR